MRQEGHVTGPFYTPRATDPRPDSIWIHKKTGGIYRIVLVGIREADLEPMVVYRLEGEFNDYWIRPLWEFKERFTARDGKAT